MPRRRAVPAVLAALVACVILVGCGRATDLPSPTPADFTGMRDILSRAGITVANVISGDAGCPDASLAKTAIAFDASGLDQVQPVRVRVYIFRNRDAWQRLSGSVAACARSYVSDPATYESLAPSPYVVSSQGPWGPGFAAALRSAFTAAAGSGD
ncbi:MAG: hypothetical protein M3P84_06915 [Chloroflexota bacterium]|nr:hypothetical protein [Chloroflexota bacterium]